MFTAFCYYTYSFSEFLQANFENLSSYDKFPELKMLYQKLFTFSDICHKLQTVKKQIRKRDMNQHFTKEETLWPMNYLKNEWLSECK